ncbi:pH-responsive protein 1 [Diutina catenulata]
MKLTSVLTLAAAASALNPINVIGDKFYDSKTNERFMIKGIAYQRNTANASDGETFNDPLADADACKRDVEYFKKLDTNVLRVYALHGNKSHDECMKTFADAGIYVIADLSEPDTSINRDSPEWTVNLLDRYTAVVDSMSKYDNTLGFFAGNEVSNAKNNTDASAFVKAAVRDTKKYIKDNEKKIGRYIPVGYSANDDPDIRVDIADYFACGTEDDRADFFGINMYEWCGSKSSYDSSGYKDRTDDFKNLTIPIFFSEYGCNTDRPRKFDEVQAIYGEKEMTDVWSGGIVYMYYEEENEYGLVSVDGNKVSTLKDFENLSSQMKKLSSTSYPKASKTSGSSETLSCPATGKNWHANEKLPPTPDKEVCECVVDSLECVLADDVDSKSYGKLFGQICGASSEACGAINKNAQAGEYGGVSFCSDKDKLSYVLNAYYLIQNKQKDACDWNGLAQTVKPKADDKCSKKVESATKQTADGSATGGGGDSEGSSSNGSQASSSESGKDKSAAGSTRSMGKVELLGLAGLVTAFAGGVSFILF